jgi:hypothetical protein
MRSPGPDPKAGEGAAASERILINCLMSFNQHLFPFGVKDANENSTG